jgi:hypothetical protein
MEEFLNIGNMLQFCSSALPAKNSIAAHNNGKEVHLH